jgi:hypothetical protein
LINGVTKEIKVIVKSMKDNLKGSLKLIAEDGWKIKPERYDFGLSKKNDEQMFTFSVEQAGNALSSFVNASVESDGKKFNKSSVTIDYPHIQPQIVLPVAEAKIVKMNGTKKVVNRICYIMGSGDMIPGYLTELGYNVDVITNEGIVPDNLKQYDAIITGIRAYNTNQRLALNQGKLMEYVNEGGTLIVQYNTLDDILAAPGPYELIISRDRVTEEDSPIKILNEEHPLFNFPNKITLKDFDGWIQERGLYYPNGWDQRYEPLLEMNDSGELPKQGALLYTKYGKGVFIYTGLSFFRQLPAGVEGAYKLFINMMSAGKYEEQ